MIGKDPFGAMVLTVGVCLTGAFALVLHTGASSREAKEMHYDFNFRGAAAAVTSVFDDVQRGGKILQSKTGQFFAGFFGGETAGYTASAAGGGTAAEQQEAVQDGDDGGFRWSDSRDYGEEEQPSGNSLGDGFEASFGGGSSNSSAASEEGPAAPAQEAARKKAGAAQAKPAAAAYDKLPPPPPGRGYSAGRGGIGIAALRRGYANLSGNGGAQAQAGGASSGGSSSGGYRPGTSGGSAGRFAGGQAAGAASWDRSGGGAMDAAMDSLRSGAQSSYNSSVGKGAPSVSAAAASSGKAAPSASAAAEVSGGSAGSSEAGAPGKTASSPAASSKKEYSFSPYSGYGDTEQDEVGLIKSVVTERLKGGETKYVTRDGVGALDESLLKAGAVPAGSVEKGLVTEEADPAKFKELPAARQAELKKEIHVFLRQVESKYGAMADIFSTSCSQAAEVCSEHGLTEPYITMTTVKGYRLTLGVKYVENRWRRYTVSFKK